MGGFPAPANETSGADIAADIDVVASPATGYHRADGLLMSRDVKFYVPAR
jgi:hypothetical protein